MKKIIFVFIILFFACNSKEAPEKIYSNFNLSVVGFSDKIESTILKPVYSMDILEDFKEFIYYLDWGKYTSFYYAINKGIDTIEEGQNDLSQELDNKFLILFTDGIDNRSPYLFKEDGIEFSKNQDRKFIINKIKRLEKNSNYKIFTLGLYGDDLQNSGFDSDDLKDYLINFDSFKAPKIATNSQELQESFNYIADLLLGYIINLQYMQSNSNIPENNPDSIRFIFKNAKPISYNNDLNNIDFYVEGEFSNKDWQSPQFRIKKIYTDFLGEEELLKVNKDLIIGYTQNGEDYINFGDIELTYQDIKYMIGTDKNNIIIQKYKNNKWIQDSESGTIAQKMQMHNAISLVLDMSESLGDDRNMVVSSAKELIDFIYSKLNADSYIPNYSRYSAEPEYNDNTYRSKRAFLNLFSVFF